MCGSCAYFFFVAGGLVEGFRRGELWRFRGVGLHGFRVCFFSQLWTEGSEEAQAEGSARFSLSSCVLLCLLV